MDTKSEHITAAEAYLEEGQVTPDTRAVDIQGVVSPQDHKDGLHRYVTVKPEDKEKDHFLQADDGKLEVLRVQLAPTNRSSNNLNATWERPKQLSALKSLWRSFRNSPRDIIRWTFDDYLKSGNKSDFYFKYPAACLLLTCTAMFGNLEGDLLWGGRYPPVRYSYYCYPKVARNEREGKTVISSIPIHSLEPAQTSQDSNRSLAGRPVQTVQPRHDMYDKAFGRHLRPRYLCVMDNSPKGYDIKDVDEWDRHRSEAESGGYIFVSYTRIHFATPDDGAEELVAIGMASAKQARLQAFWLDFFCLPGGLADLQQQDSHRICDIARGAYKMVIAVKDRNPGSTNVQTPTNLDHLLQGWASRLWTLPELLLAPTRHDLAVYWVRPDEPWSTSTPADTIAKRNMAERAYMKDGIMVRQLVDHFEASLQLTQTELFTIGLECLLNRTFSAYFPADPIYALMTLARRRPVPNAQETLFEAFAQLSLLNDSNMLLERLLCTLPKKRGSPWHKIEDFWNVKLWDIVPTVQVAAITPDDSVLIDGAFGASIEWKELTNVGVLKRRTIWRTIGSFIVLVAPGWLILACVLLALESKKIPSSYKEVTSSGSNIPHLEVTYTVNPVIAAGIIFFLIAIATIASLPYFVLGKYRGKFWSTQAQLFGLEGHADLDWLERTLFGISDGRLKWAAAGSTQSRHKQKYNGDHIEGEYEALEPVDDPLPVADPLPKESQPLDPDRVFTIVDTYSMTAMVIRAVHPPSVALICGHEGGMRRALLCSYDYSTQTFHRETVIRMPTKVLDRMDRIDKFRFSMKSMPLGRRRNVNGQRNNQ